MKFALVLSVLFFLSACGLRRPHEPTFNEKMLDIQKTRIENGEDVNAEDETKPSSDPLQSSLWAKSVGSPYIIRNQKASKVGDLLTIIVNERAEASTTATTETTRESDVELDGTLGLGSGSISQKGGISGEAETTNDFSGEGTTDRSGRLTATVQAAVENVLQNGTLFVRGRKVVTINHEDQEVEISGFVRPDDIRIGNTVTSNMMADAEIRYLGKGIISDKQRGGWGGRLIDWVWPF